MIKIGTRNSPWLAAIRKEVQSSSSTGIELTQIKTKTGKPIAITAIDHMSQASKASCSILCRAGVAWRGLCDLVGSLATRPPPPSAVLVPMRIARVPSVGKLVKAFPEMNLITSVLHAPREPGSINVSTKHAFEKAAKCWFYIIPSQDGILCSIRMRKKGC